MATASVSNPLLPVRMLNEFAYCPRLFYLMHVEGLWADNEYTEEGRNVHRRLDRAVDGVLDAPVKRRSKAETAEAAPAADLATEGDEEPKIARSVSLGSERLGITGKLDLVAVDAGEAVPVDTKRGPVPENPERSWEPDRIQIMAQALLLREHGFSCKRGVLYYAGSRRRVDVPLTPELEARTLSIIEAARTATYSRSLPPPLVDSKKCPGCSLVGICLPDETNLLRSVPADPAAPEVRRMYPARAEARPLYVQEHGATVGKSGENIIVRKEGQKLADVKLKDLAELVICGNVTVSEPAIHTLCEAGVPIVHLSGGNWFYGITNGIQLRNASDRAAQFSAAADPERCERIAKAFVAAKITNQRTMLRRNGEGIPESVFADLKRVADQLDSSSTLGGVLGVEGAAAAIYFGHFGKMLRPRAQTMAFDFEARNRRPPLDPVNAMLSFAYAMLSKECTVALLAAGLDPYWGLMHQPRHGRPALALDLMEEFRPIVADSAVVTVINTGVVIPEDFVIGVNSCALKPTGRKRFIEAYEARLDQMVTHPIFNYRCTWRQVIRLQARLLGRHLRGDLPVYPGMTTR
ncbi:MAG: CRISPR-associated endonuclease Cas1 [Acidobacteriota bacterium]